MFKGAIFDQDGLLFDTEKIYQESWIQAAAEQGVSVPVEFPRLFCGRSPAAIAEIIQGAYPQLDIPAYCERAVRLAWDRQLAGVPEKKPGLLEMLGFCRERGIKTAVASSSTISVVRHNLESSGVAGYFDAVVTGDEVVNGKPSPDIFLLAAERLGLDARDCCVFEDAPSGIRGAFAAGARPVLIPDQAVPDEETLSICRVYPDLAAARDALLPHAADASCNLLPPCV